MCREDDRDPEGLSCEPAPDAGLGGVGGQQVGPDLVECGVDLAEGPEVIERPDRGTRWCRENVLIPRECRVAVNGPLPPVMTAGSCPRSRAAVVRSRTWIWAPPMGSARVTRYAILTLCGCSAGRSRSSDLLVSCGMRRGCPAFHRVSATLLARRNISVAFAGVERTQVRNKM